MREQKQRHRCRHTGRRILRGVKMADKYLSGLATEKVDGRFRDIDLASTEEILRIINEEDRKVAPAVAEEIPHIAAAADEIVRRMKSGGRLFYIGAGTSGRLGVLDASECPPTYGVSPDLVQGIIAGGDSALRRSSEGCEDDEDEGRREIARHGITGRDTVVGISASGRAPYCIGAVDAARGIGAFTVGIVTNKDTILAGHVDVCIAAAVGSEVVAGSTRMKSGTAQKMILNMLSTAVMIRLGKVYGNRMVDLHASNEKLKDRAVRLFTDATGADEEKARSVLKEAGYSTKLAIMMYLSGLPKDKAAKRLDDCGGVLRKALEGAD